MEHRRVLKRRIISADGRSIAKAESIAYASGDTESIISQTIMLNISSDGYVNYTSSSSSSSSASSSK